MKIAVRSRTAIFNDYIMISFKSTQAHNIICSISDYGLVFDGSLGGHQQSLNINELEVCSPHSLNNFVFVG